MTDQEALRAEVASRRWYHTLELPGGIVTPGQFDHRPVLSQYGLPADLSGRRVLDIASFDGYWAFEMERRGGDVTCIDIPDVRDQDYPEPLRRQGVPETEQQRTNFDVAREAFGSKVHRHLVTVYDVDKAGLGQFDFVFVGSLLLHLRDPIGALMSIRRVCRGTLMLVEETDEKLDKKFKDEPVARLASMTPWMTWWIPNTAALKEYLNAAGFLDVHQGNTFTIPFGSQKGGVRHTVLTARSPGD